MKTGYLESFDQFNYTVATTAITSGAPRLVGDRLGVAVIGGAVGEVVPMRAVGHHKLQPKATGEAWTKHAKLYWNNTNGNFTTTASGATLRGFAGADAASGDTTGEVILTGQAV